MVPVRVNVCNMCTSVSSFKELYFKWIKLKHNTWSNLPLNCILDCDTVLLQQINSVANIACRCAFIINLPMQLGKEGSFLVHCIQNISRFSTDKVMTFLWVIYNKQKLSSLRNSRTSTKHWKWMVIKGWSKRGAGRKFWKLGGSQCSPFSQLAASRQLSRWGNSATLQSTGV